MIEKRPLVWLSAANSDSRVRKEMEARWSLINFNIEAPSPLTVAVPAEARIGVLELPETSGQEWLWPETCLESLGVTYWVAIAPRLPTKGTELAKFIVRYCSDFHTVPVDCSRLNTVLGHLWGMAAIIDAVQPHLHDYQHVALQGNSRPIRHVRSLLHRFSETLEPVLITGEGGTGKDAAARFVHSNSPRASGPMITVNCAALPASLTQSELFGYEKGAFTSAQSRQQGRLEQANGGSLLLSGINELQLQQQSAILRFLQEGEVERVGGHARIVVDGRIIATSSEPLPDLIACGRFRSDVYFRLGTLEVRLPSLKERHEDIPWLAQSLLKISSSETGHKKLGKKAIQSLVSHSWPGNFQELQNRVRQAALLSDRSVLEPEDLGLSLPGSGTNEPSNLSLKEFRDQADRQALHSSLRLANNNMSEAARLLQISRASLYRLMEKHTVHATDHSQKKQIKREI